MKIVLQTMVADILCLIEKSKRDKEIWNKTEDIKPILRS